MVDPVGGFGFLDRIVDVHFGNSSYVLIRGSGQMTKLGTSASPPPPKNKVQPRLRTTLTSEAHTTSATTGAGTLWYAFASPSGQTTPQHPLPFGYDNVAAFLADNPGGVGPGQGLHLQGIPPDNPFPGSNNLMSPQAEAEAFAALVTGTTGINGVTYGPRTFVTPATWAAGAPDASTARRNWSETAVFSFSSLGAICLLNASGCTAGDINNGGFNVSVYNNVKPPPGGKVTASFLQTLVPDWAIFRNTPNDGPALDGTFLFTVSKGITLLGKPGLRISAPGFHD